MNRVLRSSAFTLATGYVAFGFAALILFAAPLWYAWQVTIQDGHIMATDGAESVSLELRRLKSPAGPANR